MSIKAYEWFISDLHPFDILNKIKQSIDAIFYLKIDNMIHKCESLLEHNQYATWEDAGFEFYSKFQESHNNQKIKDVSFIAPVACSRYVNYLRDLDDAHSLANFGYRIILLEGPRIDNNRTTVFKLLSGDNDYKYFLRDQDWCSDFSYQDSEEDNGANKIKNLFWSHVDASHVSDMGFTLLNPSETEVLFFTSSKCNK